MHIVQLYISTISKYSLSSQRPMKIILIVLKKEVKNHLENSVPDYIKIPMSNFITKN